MKKTIILLFGIIILMFGCIFYSGIKIAKFDAGNVSLQEAIDVYKSISVEERYKINTEDDFFKLVRKIALQKIIINRAYKNGFDKDIHVLASLDRIKKNIGYDIFKKSSGVDRVKLIDNDFKKYTKKYDLYQIVKKTDSPDKAKIEKSKKILSDLAKEVKDLNSFMDLAKKYSDDVTAQNGGFIGSIRLGMMDEEIDKVLEKQPVGKVSDVVETSVGVHLFFIGKIQEVSIKELYKDKELVSMITHEKQNAQEEAWYEKLIKESKMIINSEAIKEKKLDDTAVVTYKDKKVTRKELFETIEKYRQGSFPEPTNDEILRLAKNMGLNLIIEEKIMDKSVVSTKEFQQRLQREKEYAMINEYIEKNVVIQNISDKSISDYYMKNKAELFTFKMDNGKTVIQPLNEVKEYISQKLTSANKQEAKYDLYKKLVTEDKLEIDNKVLKQLVGILKK